MLIRTVLLALCGVIAGCGLTLDYDPPSARDAGRSDASPHGRDTGVTDGGMDAGCRTERDCDDDDACNGAELCVAGACTAGEPVQCQDHDVCDGTDACDPRTGQCVASTGLACAMDTNPCNGIERCDPVIGCTTSPAPSCDDGVACTADSCDAVHGCLHLPDSSLCTAMTGGVCTTTGCDYPTCIEGVTCIAEQLCVTAHCQAGTCVRTPIACAASQTCCAGVCVPSGCDDGIACTDDSCVLATGCQHLPHAGSCDDHDPCTSRDHCTGTTCAGVTGVVCPSPDVCNVGVCTTAGCTTMPTSGNPCSDGNPCTAGDSCVAGACHPGTGLVLCDDANECTADQCDPVAGCTSPPVPDGTACSIGAADGTCEGGVCVGPCVDGLQDCDGDGICECAGACSAGGAGGMCIVRTMNCLADGCGLAEVCCDHGARRGQCYIPACASCCP